MLRNIFDQYEQPENRLTHALVTLLDQERRLLVPFLRWLGIRDAPKSRAIQLTEQQVPGILRDDGEDFGSKGLPDAAMFDETGWAVLFESKVQSRCNLEQVERHRRTAQRHGYESPWIILISVDKLSCKLSQKAIAITWQDVYVWLNSRTEKSIWREQFVRYMQVFERKMLLQEYQIRGTITVFDGLRFCEDNPYTYREAKRLIRLLGDQLQQRDDLRKIVNRNGDRRPAITGKDSDQVWDFLPLIDSFGSSQFTSHPHLDIVIGRTRATAAVTIPNGVKGGFRGKVIALGIDGFRSFVIDIVTSLKPILKKSKGSRPIMYVTQCHFRAQNSPAEIDARLEVDLRTALTSSRSSVRFQPEWVDSIYEILINKRSNIQFGLEVQFDYTCPVVQSHSCGDLFAESWKAILPLVKSRLIN